MFLKGVPKWLFANQCYACCYSVIVASLSYLCKQKCEWSFDLVLKEPLTYKAWDGSRSPEPKLECHLPRQASESSNFISLCWEYLVLLQRAWLSSVIKSISWTSRNKSVRGWKWKRFEIFGASGSLYILRVVAGGLCPAPHGSESKRACSSWRNVFVWPWRSRSVPSFWWLLIHARWINEALTCLAFGSFLNWHAWRKWSIDENKQLNAWLTEDATVSSVNIETSFNVSMQVILRVKSGHAARCDDRFIRRP